MSRQVQLAVVGAGPAGLAAADEAARLGIEVLLVDEQPGVGGQIYRGITRSNPTVENVLGADYVHGKSLLGALRHDSIEHVPDATVWQVTPERDIYFSTDDGSTEVRAQYIVLATGALERPMPIPGWTLPGVMTAGAGQVLLKTSRLVPHRDIVLAGSGPLLLLVAVQYLRAGADVRALVETTPRGNYVRGLRYLSGALRGHYYLRKGMELMREIRSSGIAHFRRATGLRALGDDQLSSLQFGCRGRRYELPCTTLLLHMGVVPNVQISRALEMEHGWDPGQRCWRPRLTEHGETSLEGFFVAGDGGGIGGAMAAEHQGRIAALCVAQELGAVSAADSRRRIDVERRQLEAHRAIRPFLDALYAPSPEYLSPPDETIVCRCEEVTAGQIREFVELGCLGPNQAKAFGRPGMGPCQGRYCGLTVSEIIADARNRPTDDIGYFRIRPPVKPVMLGELASLDCEHRESQAPPERTSV